MEKQKKQGIINRFLQGWQQVFGGTSEAGSQTRKPFPPNRFFHPEELDYLSKSDNLSPVEQWAVATGKWAYEHSKNKHTDSHYASVQWQNGLMATWIDGRLTPDSPTSQAEKISMLKEQGYEIPERYEKVINNYEASRLVGSYFSGENRIVKVTNCEQSNSPKLMLRSWDKESLSLTKSTVDYASFKESLGNSMKPLTDFDKFNFEKRLAESEQSKQLYEKVISSINKSYLPVMGGRIPFEFQKVHELKDNAGKVIPISWSLDNRQTIKVGVCEAQSTGQTRHIGIDETNAYKYKSILATIYKAVDKERINGMSYAVVSTLGNDLGENKIYAKKDNSPLFRAERGTVNAVVAMKDGRTIAFNLENHQEISLTGKEPGILMEVLKTEADTERQRLRDMIGIPLMKDYVESMSDKNDLSSGNMNYLPSHTSVNNLYCKYERISEELHSYTHGSFPVETEVRDKMVTDGETAHLAFKSEMKKMVDAYNNHTYSFTDNDVRKLVVLDSILWDKDRTKSMQPPSFSQEDLRTIGVPQKEIDKGILASSENKEVKKTEVKNEAAPAKVRDEVAEPIVQSSEKVKEQNLATSRFVAPSLLDSIPEGRWHTPELMEKRAYQEIGSLLADSKGLGLSKEGEASVPMDISGHKYTGATALLLHVVSQNKGYEMPVFLSLATMKEKGIQVKSSALAIPVITKDGIEHVYNIEETDYPIKHPQEFNNMKLNQLLESRIAKEDKEAISVLVNNDRFTTKTSFDSNIGSALYSVADNTIHVAPEEDYEKKDGFLQDFSNGLVMSTRKAKQASSRFEDILKESLIAHLGSGLVGQKYTYNVGETTGSNYWKERLKSDPNYTKEVVKAAERSSEKIISYVDKLQKGQNQSSNLDLRSTTPVDIDVDGNGIVESQENLAADKKQGASEEESNGQVEVHHQVHKFHRGI